MQKSNPTIFRPEALRRHLSRRDQAVFPKLASPRIFMFLWLLLGFLLTGAFLVWLTRVPVYAAARAVVVPKQTSNPQEGRDVVMLVFSAPQNLSLLKVGQKVFIKTTEGTEQMRGSLFAVEPQVLSVQAVRDRYEVDIASQVQGATAVAMARFEKLPEDPLLSNYPSGHYPVKIEVGTNRAVTFFPIVGRFFDR